MNNNRRKKKRKRLNSNQNKKTKMYAILIIFTNDYAQVGDLEGQYGEAKSYKYEYTQEEHEREA